MLLGAYSIHWTKNNNILFVVKIFSTTVPRERSQMLLKQSKCFALHFLSDSSRWPKRKAAFRKETFRLHAYDFSQTQGVGNANLACEIHIVNHFKWLNQRSICNQCQARKWRKMCVLFLACSWRNAFYFAVFIHFVWMYICDTIPPIELVVFAEETFASRKRISRTVCLTGYDY